MGQNISTRATHSPPTDEAETDEHDEEATSPRRNDGAYQRIINVGRAALKISKVETLRFDFRDFANLEQKKDEGVFSPSLVAHGYTWRLAVYPRGTNESKSDPVFVAAYLELIQGKEEDDPNPSVTITYAIRHPSREIAVVAKNRTVAKHEEWGFHDLIERDTVLSPSKGMLSSDGTLSFLVDIQVCEDFIRSKKTWTPTEEKPTEDYLKLLEDTQGVSDVAFRVGDTEKTTDIRAHRCILSVRAPSLYDLVNDAAEDGTVVLTDVKPTVFNALLRFVYGRELPQPEFLSSHCRELLEAADRFGCELLKLHMESYIVKSVLDASNAAEWVLFADSHSCALLKEKAIELFIFDQKAVMESPGWSKVKESAAVLSDFLNAQVVMHHGVPVGCKRSRPDDDDDDDDEDNVDSMDVATLRQRLDDEGMEVFGTREMLVKRLKRLKRN
mmetsp:Transcript_18991/g.28085  ORF Transcript_18991/g.28085 Transcript_18991/m.28085 type:complete len:443 (-) Transcript_18991:123-1451(-)|eukprot:CAMPEP_0194047202 /NCGR_PEP_ID=MMETSP0009_2-20130614/23620_1 /TAXON_ID=210454 /ORGANISM="Grammatophora oceanica, Strain CCMP 410" /LENGTH=442 /DNA_ID=CAMNT_0038692741 /DNA_START=136 /DNA_END=1464 /DNA_ORIENTATION=+